jgi:hypothetical protein
MPLFIFTDTFFSFSDAFLRSLASSLVVYMNIFLRNFLLEPTSEEMRIRGDDPIFSVTISLCLVSFLVSLYDIALFRLPYSSISLCLSWRRISACALCVSDVIDDTKKTNKAVFHPHWHFYQISPHSEQSLVPF